MNVMPKTDNTFLVPDDSVCKINDDILVVKVTIICSYIFLRIELKSRFACTKFCDLLRGIGTGSTISNAQYCQ